MPTIESLLLYCRAGFEKECAAEITEVAGRRGVTGYCKTKPDSAFVLFVPSGGDNQSLAKVYPGDLVFARQVAYVAAFVSPLPTDDRVAALLPTLQAMRLTFSELRLETADTNAAKELSRFCRPFARPLQQALQRAQLLATNPAAPVLHIFFLNSTAAYVAWSDPAHSSPWPLGIPRLKFPAGAPSRSTLKLEEAFLTFLDARQRAELLRNGLTAVDLGAAPGGWTWQLLKYGLSVTAVDNGALDKNLLHQWSLEHVRADGFSYRPERPVDWLVCDIVEQPSRIAALVGRWLAEGWCRQTIFNLKLPMTKRYEELQRCRAVLEDALQGTPYAGQVRFKQLYHDREEVTGHIGSAG